MIPLLPTSSRCMPGLLKMIRCQFHSPRAGAGGADKGDDDVDHLLDAVALRFDRRAKTEVSEERVAMMQRLFDEALEAALVTRERIERLSE